ncbi:leucine zipper protein 2 isoform X5 [Taeniopygia guttata]|uniref:leucine zipper protein 2 isoform X5 n=1 Tax=Taeniopygia guttata TaxID=59729 RepID=UPI003BB90EED
MTVHSSRKDSQGTELRAARRAPALRGAAWRSGRGGLEQPGAGSALRAPRSPLAALPPIAPAELQPRSAFPSSRPPPVRAGGGGVGGGEDGAGVRGAERSGRSRASMKFLAACCVLPLFSALVSGTGQGYEELERQLKEVFKERSNILHQLLKTSKELQGIKVNLQSLKNDEASTKNDVQKLLEMGQNQREMKSLHEAFQKQLNEAAEKAEKQQATIKFLKTEMERKSKIIRDLQNENKSLKNKLLSGNKLCGMHAEESKKIQAQLKELRYGKKDLIFKAQQLTDLEQKLSVAKDKLENAALDQVRSVM